jgi:hypothetical protein
MNMDDEDLERNIRDLLHHPQRESAQDRALAFAQRRLDRDMEEAARLRRGGTRRKVGRVLIGTFAVLLVAAGVATATDSHFLRQVLGKDTPLADRVGSVNGTGVTATPSSFADPGSTAVDDATWSFLKSTQRMNGDATRLGSLTSRADARVLLVYKDAQATVGITAAPTNKRAACWTAMGSVNLSGCTLAFSRNAPLTARVKQTSTGWAVAGLAADEVDAVTIKLGNGNRTAVLRNNAFFWITTDQSERPESVQAELADGRHGLVKLSFPTA